MLTKTVLVLLAPIKQSSGMLILQEMRLHDFL